MKRCLIALMIIASVPVAANAYPSSGERLVWDCIVTTGPVPRNSDNTLFSYTVTLLRFSYLRDDVMLWTHEVPDDIKAWAESSVLSGRPGRMKGDTLYAVEAGTPQHFWSFYDDIFFPAEIAVSFEAGFLLLEKSQGKLLTFLSYPESRGEGDGLFTPETNVCIQIKKDTCENASTWRRGEFTERCGKYLFHYNGSLLFVFNEQYELINTHKGNARIKGIESGNPHIKARITMFRHRNYRVRLFARVRVLVR